MLVSIPGVDLGAYSSLDRNLSDYTKKAYMDELEVYQCKLQANDHGKGVDMSHVTEFKAQSAITKPLRSCLRKNTGTVNSKHVKFHEKRSIEFNKYECAHTCNLHHYLEMEEPTYPPQVRSYEYGARPLGQVQNRSMESAAFASMLWRTLWESLNL